MKAKELSSIRFTNFNSDEWDKTITEFDATINYTSWYLNYIEILNAKSNIKNYTFLIHKNNNPVAIVPLYLENIETEWQISMGQEPVFAPIFIKTIDKSILGDLYQYLISKIDTLAEKFDCKLARFQYAPLLHNDFFQNYYKDFGFVEDILYPDWYIFKAKKSLIIDLNQDISDLYSSVRKSNKPHINKTRRETKCFILDNSNFDQALFDDYVALYLSVKGNRRSLSAFSLDASAIKSGLEVIILCQYNDSIVGAIALHTFNNKARYNSSVQDPKINRVIYPNHYLLWKAINYLKDNKYHRFEIGEQINEKDNAKITDKERNLAHFKSGWGGDLVPWLKIQKNYY
jgi:hypothetical protein